MEQASSSEKMIYIPVYMASCIKLNSRRGKVKFTLEQAMKAQRGSRGIALLFL
jgi:hypothetical protein